MKYTIKLLKIQINHEILKEKNERFKNKKPTISSTLTEEICLKIIKEVENKKNLNSETETLILITGLLQRGGSNKSAGNSITYEFEGKTLTAQELQGIIKSIQKNATNRQLSRSLANEIAEIALSLGIEGDLANQMRYEVPDLTLEEAAWCSNFQTQNMNCPDRVRNWLVNNYKSRFNK